MEQATLQEERKLWQKGYKNIVCLDEAGRGALAGPVVACAVAVATAKLKIKNAKFKITIKNLKLFKGIKDSKKLTPKKRKKLYEILIKHPGIVWGMGKVYPAVIDRINILEATKLAMMRAVGKLKTKYKKPKIDFLILDGLMKLNIDIPQKAIVKADEKVFSCAVASIIAKVKRDQAMRRYHKKYPEYGFKQHKGYGTREHIKMLKKLDRCAIHRNSFNCRTL